MEMVLEQGQEELTAKLKTLREQLLEWTTRGQEVGQREEALKSIGADTTREDLLDLVVEAGLAGERAKVETLVAVGRGLIDYVFYQQLTGRIDAAEAEGRSSESTKLTSLRDEILDLTAALDARVEEEARQAATFLQEVLDSNEPETLLREHPERVDPMFLEILQGNLDAAEQRGHAEVAEGLKKVRDIVVEMIEEGQPPAVRLISRLLNAEYPDETQKLLADNLDQLDPEFMEALAAIVEDLAGRGQSELSDRLKGIGDQATAMLDQS
jgi:hypothetical protein